MFGEKIKFENKDKVTQLREDFRQNKVDFKDIPHDVLVELFEIAIDKIDEQENGGEFDERDWKDCLCDKESIVDDLFAELEEKIKLEIYE